jgi:hypothetical protein
VLDRETLARCAQDLDIDLFDMGSLEEGDMLLSAVLILRFRSTDVEYRRGAGGVAIYGTTGMDCVEQIGIVQMARDILAHPMDPGD